MLGGIGWVGRASLVAAVLAAAIWAGIGYGADPAFVGSLSLAVDPEVAKQLELTDETLAKLKAVIEQREADAAELLNLKELPPEEQAAKKAAFVAESEKQGLAVLSDAQRTKLSQIRISKLGMLSLGEPAMAEKLKLQKGQVRKINELIAERTKALAQAAEGDRPGIEASYEKQLADNLFKEQKAVWEQLAGLAPAGPLPMIPVPAGSPAAGPAGSDPRNTAGSERPVVVPGKIQFKFRFAPWKDVLDWFAKTADLSLVLVGDAAPPGTFNYTDSKEYTPAEAIDLLNSILQTKGYTLVRRNRMLMLYNMADGPLPLAAVERVPLEDLDTRGTYEIVQVLFTIEKLAPEEAQQEVSKLLSTQGNIVILPRARQLLVTETAGKLRIIRDVITAIENPDALTGKLHVMPLKSATVEEVMLVARQLLGIAEGRYETSDNSLRIAVDPLGTRLLVRGKPDMIDKFNEIVKLIDDPGGVEDMGPKGPVDAPQLEVYPIKGADPMTVLQVLQTILAGQPNVRLSLDAANNQIVLLGTNAQHATVKATLSQLERDAKKTEVIILRILDASAAATAINKLFVDDKSAPKIEAEAGSRVMMVRGTHAQIDQIRGLLVKLGETETSGSVAGLAATDRGNVRVIGITSPKAQQAAIEQLQALAPALGRNNIRVVATHAAIRSSGTRQGPHVEGEEAPLGPKAPEKPEPKKPEPMLPPIGGKPAARLDRREGTTFIADPAVNSEVDEALDHVTFEYVPALDLYVFHGKAKDVQRRVELLQRILARQAEVAGIKDAEKASPIEFIAALEKYVVRGKENAKKVEQLLTGVKKVEGKPADAPAPKEKETDPEVPEVAPKPEKPTVPEKPARETKPGADIVIAPGPGGIVIASEDKDALDRLESLLQAMVQGNQLASGRSFNIFYLKFAKAQAVAEILQEIMGVAPSEDGGGGSLMGDLAGAMLGGGGGGLVDALLGGGGGGGPAAAAGGGALSIVPELRLNALVVQGTQRDIDAIEQLLDVLDQESSILDVQTVAKPRMIPVQHVAAADIAEVVRSVYANRVDSVGGGQQPRQASPQELIQALRGGRGGNARGGAGGQRNGQAEPQRLTIGVDMRSNSLIVSAPEPLFQEVKLLVAQLDQAGTESTETVQTIAIKRANPQVVQQAISSVMGNKVTLTQTAANTGRTSAGGTAPGQAGQAGRGQGGNRGPQNGGGQQAFGQGGQGADLNMIRALMGGGGQGARGGQGGGARGGQGGAGGARGGAAGGRAAGR